MFGFRDWTEISKPRDLAKIFESQEYTKWRGFREIDDARFVTLVMPRVIARLPYGAATVPVEGFAYEQTPREAGDAQRPMHEAMANAAISARLPYPMATSCFAHSLKVIRGLGAEYFPTDPGWHGAVLEVAFTEAQERTLAGTESAVADLSNRNRTDRPMFTAPFGTNRHGRVDCNLVHFPGGGSTARRVRGTQTESISGWLGRGASDGAAPAEHRFRSPRQGRLNLDLATGNARQYGAVEGYDTTSSRLNEPETVAASADIEAFLGKVVLLQLKRRGIGNRSTETYKQRPCEDR
jgi:hypothetical protein